MTLPGADESLLRRYLLGSVTDAARKDLETKLFSDDRIFWERISIAEDELVSDYVQNALSEAERQDFEKHFLCTDERRSKVEFASALHTHARAARPVTQEQPSPRESRWAWLRRPALSPAWAMAAAAVLLVAVQVLPVRPRGSDGLDVVAIAVPAERTRAAGGELTRVHLHPNSRIVELQLDPGSSNFTDYRALVYQVDDDALLADTKVGSGAAAGKPVTLTLPAALLDGGDYYIRLQGVSPGGAPPVPLQRYDFRIIRD